MASVHEYVCLDCGSLTRTDGTLVPQDEQYGSESQEDN